MRFINTLITAAAFIAAAVVWVRGRRDPTAGVDSRRIRHDYPEW